MAKLRLAVIGAGLAFQNLHLPQIVRKSDAIDLIGVATSSVSSADTAAELIAGAIGSKPQATTDIDALLSLKPDAVLLNVPIAATHAIALELIEAGVDVICEKPLGESAIEAAQLCRAAESAGVTLAVCENFRYQGKFSQVRALVESGTIGDLKAYFLNDLHYTPADGIWAVTPWRQSGEHRGGYLLDGGSHIVAGLRAMAGETPSTVTTLATSFHPDHLGRPWDTALVNLKFDSGMVGHLALGYGTPDKEARNPKVYGTEGTIALKKTGVEIWRADPNEDELIELTDSSDGVAAEWDDFIAALSEKRSVAHSAWEAATDLAVFDAIMLSAETGTPIEVQDPRTLAPNR